MKLKHNEIIINEKITLNETQNTRTVTMLNLKNGKTDKFIYYKKIIRCILQLQINILF